MSLSITFTQKERLLCPQCGAMAGHRDIREVDRAAAESGTTCWKSSAIMSRTLIMTGTVRIWS